MLQFTSPQISRYADVLAVLTQRHVKTRYRGSALGVIWSLLNPVAMTLVYTMVLGHAFSNYYHNSTVDYMLAVFIGLTANSFFASSTSQALRAVVDSSGLINKVRTPCSVYPSSLMLASCFQLVVGAVPVLAVICLLLTRSPLNVLALAVPFGSLILLALGTAYIASALYVFFRDIPYMYELLMFALWVATPVFYPLAILSDKYRPYVEWNPLTQIIETLRDLIFRNGPITAFGLLEPLLAGALAAVGGWAIFRALNMRFMDYL